MVYFNWLGWTFYRIWGFTKRNMEVWSFLSYFYFIDIIHTCTEIFQLFRIPLFKFSVCLNSHLFFRNFTFVVIFYFIFRNRFWSINFLCISRSLHSLFLGWVFLSFTLFTLNSTLKPDQNKKWDQDLSCFSNSLAINSLTRLWWKILLLEESGWFRTLMAILLKLFNK